MIFIFQNIAITKDSRAPLFLLPHALISCAHLKSLHFAKEALATSPYWNDSLEHHFLPRVFYLTIHPLKYSAHFEVLLSDFLGSL